jgi:KUP system potassium uptake protein
VSGEPQQNLLPLTFGCIGVVYGDIGTSPLYAFREAVNAAQATLGIAVPQTLLARADKLIE